jgi:hypothetical protein
LPREFAIWILILAAEVATNAAPSFATVRMRQDFCGSRRFLRARKRTARIDETMRVCWTRSAQPGSFCPEGIKGFETQPGDLGWMRAGSA